VLKTQICVTRPQCVKERRGYSHLKEEALDRTMWRARFGRGFGPVVRQTTKWMNIKWIVSLLLKVAALQADIYDSHWAAEFFSLTAFEFSFQFPGRPENLQDLKWSSKLDLLFVYARCTNPVGGERPRFLRGWNENRSSDKKWTCSSIQIPCGLTQHQMWA